MTAVAVRMQVCRIYEIDAELLENRHEYLTCARDALFAFRAFLYAVLKHITVQQCDGPFLMICRKVTPEPCHLAVAYPLWHSRGLLPLRTQHHEMRIAIVERVIVILVVRTAVIRHIEIVQISLGAAHLPVERICLMIAENGHERYALRYRRDRIEPSLTLRAILAVIYEIAHIDIKINIRFALRCALDEMCPVRIVVGLRIREDECLEVTLIRRGRHERLPVSGASILNDTVCIRARRLKVIKQCVVLIDVLPIIREERFHSLHLRRLARGVAQLYTRCGFKLRFGLPYDTP